MGYEGSNPSRRTMQKKLPLSYIELSKKNLIHNIKQFRGLAEKKTKIMAVIKANAYGHGQNQIAKILEPYADYFGVNSVLELEFLRKVTRKKTFVLGYVAKADLPKTIKLGSVISVFSIKQMLTISAIAKSLNKTQEAQIAIDAHLGREGVLPSELPKFLKEAKKLKNIKITGMYAHFANIEDTTNPTHSKKQITEYKKALKVAKEFGFKNIQTHISATSGLLMYETDNGYNDIVRIGIGLYGLWPAVHIKNSYKNRITLKPVLAWKTHIAQVKTLPKGATIGYGLTYKTKKQTKVAIIPQGYADGLDRGFSNKGEVLINGRRCPILGRVMMNMFVVDVSNLKNIKAEDEVVVLGRQGKEEITAEEMAGKIGTINYEIVARLSSLLPRVVE